MRGFHKAIAAAAFGGLSLGDAVAPACLPAVAVAPAALIVVASTGDAVNGATSSVAALIADPGPDGISLREAITATNNDPGPATIRFASDPVIRVGSALPPLRGGAVTIEGPATIRGGAEVIPTPFTAALHIASSGNRIADLSVEGFFLVGIKIAPVDGPPTPGLTFADNTLERLAIRGVRDGVAVGEFYSEECGQLQPCDTHHSYLRTTVAASSIRAARFGIRVDLAKVVGDVIDSLAITGNTLTIGTAAAPDADGAPIQIGIAGISESTRIARVQVAGNVIEAVQAGGDGAIMIASGLQRARRSVIEDVRVRDNRIHVVRPDASVPCCHGIMVSAGTDYFVYDPSIYSGSPDENVARRIEISGNEVSGDLNVGALRLQAGVDAGGSRNRVEAVQVRSNVIRSSLGGQGILLWVGQVGRGLTVTGNAIQDVDIEDNDVTTGGGDQPAGASGIAGIVLLGGHDGGRDGSIRDIRIKNNRITTKHDAIQLIGGTSPAGTTAPARGNSVRCVQIAGNTATGAAATVRAWANSGAAAGNAVSFAASDTSGVVVPGGTGSGFALKDLVATGC